MKKADRAWLSRVAELGCVVCTSPAEIHHVTRTGKRSAHIGGTIPLCPIHHRLGNYGVALHSGIKAWEHKHGSQANHVKRVNAILGGK